MAVLNSSHWGAFVPEVRNGMLVGVEPFAGDPDPSPILRSIPGAVHDATRIARPAVRRGWLEGGAGRSREQRGRDTFIEMDWDAALDLLAGEFRRVIGEHGNEAIFGGSYGWSSAGRFHHAKTQLQRFLAAIGGYVGAVNTYSNAAGMVLTERVLGSGQAMGGPCTSWRSIIESSELVVMFGGLPVRNTQVTPGGPAEHTTMANLRRAGEAGVAFVNVSPVREDAPGFLDAEWLAPRPNTDTALLLGLCHTLMEEDLHDRAFLDRYCQGYRPFAAYLRGEPDGTAKTAAWAAGICGIGAEAIRGLARRMARQRTMLLMTWSLQRADHGEQPCWALIALASMLGQIGLPGGGFGFGLGSMEGIAGNIRPFPTPALPLLANPVKSFIPVARIADMLLHPGEPFQFNGQDLVYPDIKMVCWWGGNPFHHHQDINRLIRAWRRPDTVVVADCWWTATARHADIVLPATTTLERDDIGATSRDRHVIAMKKAIEPVGQARHDFAMLAELAARLGAAERFTEGRDEAAWLRHIYETARARAARSQRHWPAFDAFWEQGFLALEEAERPFVLYEDFRRDPEAAPLPTPSGRIELFSKTVAGFGYEDCPGHPAWIEPAEWLGAEKAQRFPLHMLSSQPKGRLHAQMDMEVASQEEKIGGREPIRLNPADAASRDIADGSTVRVFNERGAMLAVAVVTPAIRQGVVQIATGAWYDPADPAADGSLEKHGNPNVLTLDKGTSRLAQGPSAQTALVEIEPFEGEAPITAYRVPVTAPA